MDLLDFYKKATNMRQSYRVLRLGGFQRVPVRPSDGNPSMFDELYAFVRWCSSEEGEEEKAESAQTVAVVVLNTSTQPGNNAKALFIVANYFVSGWDTNMECAEPVGILSG